MGIFWRYGMAKHKLVCAYVFLVGFPLLGLVCTLRAGATLTAPEGVGGNWTVEADLNSWRGLPCGKLLTDAQKPLLNISQAGRDLTVVINNPDKTVLTGTIVGAALTATEVHVEEGGERAHRRVASCADSHPLGLRATVKEKGKHGSLTGTFSLDGCVACPTLAFSAIRQLGEGKVAY